MKRSHPGVTGWLERLLWQLSFAKCKRCGRYRRWFVAWHTHYAPGGVQTADDEPIGPFCPDCYPNEDDVRQWQRDQFQPERG